MLLSLHIAAGCVAVIAGFVAVAARKGSQPHRLAGLTFVASMLVLGFSAAGLGNVAGGLVAVYFSTTAFTTVRQPSVWARRVNLAAMAGAFALAAVHVAGGVMALQRPSHALNGVPFAMFFFLGLTLLAAALGDVRVWRAGPPKGRGRLARHLWRMCFAFFIATGSFFSIRSRVARILPDSLNTTTVRLVPILLPFAAMIYWLWRLRRRRLPRRVAEVVDRTAVTSV
jgi:hypothetical protein